MSATCLNCNGTGWVRRYTIGGHPEPIHCPECGDGEADPVGFEKSDLRLDELRAQIKPSTEQHHAAD